MTAGLDASDLLQLRLRRQLLGEHGPLSAGDVVRRMGAVQAQDLGAAKWAVALRARWLTDAEIEQAIAEKQLVRSWPMRGTLHFVPPEDLRWMLDLTTPKLFKRASARAKQLRLTAEDFERASVAAEEGLHGGKALTRKETLALFEAAGVSTREQRGYHLLWHLSQQGLLCFGPMRGKQPTFVLLEEWLPTVAAPTHEEALVLFARRYFGGHGPATLKDFARWTGLVMKEARTGLESIATELQRATVDGTDYWMLPSDAENAQVEPSVHLLPAFDEYLVGYGDRQLIFGEFHDRYRGKIAANGVLSPVVVSRGRVVGSWKRELSTREVAVSATLFRKLDKAERRMLAEAIERYGVYLGLPARLRD